MKRVVMQPKPLRDSWGDNMTGLHALPDGMTQPLEVILRQSYKTHRPERNAGEELEVTVPEYGVLTWLATEVPMRRYRFRAEEAYGRAKGLEPVTEGRW